MTPFLHRIWARCETALARAGHEHARRQLLCMSDRSLADAGFSRALLESGVGAWPWRLEDGDDIPVAATCEERVRRASERRAVRELRAYSDTELTELGIARADVERAVRDGRTGVDTGAPGERDDGGERRAA